MRPHLITLILLLALLPLTGAHAQLVPPGAAPQRVATGYKFTEGPALGPDGGIYFSDIPSRQVHRFDPATGETAVFLEDSGGSNGLAFDPDGRLVLCEDRDRRVSRFVDGERVLIAESFDGKRFNSPNDLVISRAGGIYFTDPRYGKQDGRELDVEAVYYIDPGAHEVLQLSSDFGRPNGVAIAPDQKTLYVADNARGEIVSFTLAGNDDKPELTSRLIFARPPEGTRGGPDGMTVDRAGNLYAAWHGDAAVHVWNPHGEPLARIELPRDGDKPVQPTNVEFAADGQTLYITAGGSLYRINLNVPPAP